MKALFFNLPTLNPRQKSQKKKSRVSCLKRGSRLIPSGFYPMEEAASNNRSSAVSSSSASAVFRRIEFHPARKPWNGFSNKGGSDFKLETLNPSFSSANKLALSSSSSVKKQDGSDSLDRALTFSITIRKIVSSSLPYPFHANLCDRWKDIYLLFVC